MSRELKRIQRQIDAAKSNLESAKDIASRNTSLIDNQLSQVGDEFERVSRIYHNPMPILDDIDMQFKKATKLNDVDVAFLFVATAMQVARQYLVTTFPDERLDDKAAAKQEKGAGVKEHSNRHHRYYNPSLDEIITNPVPFDATMGAKQYGALKGYGALGHRGATIGHDPVLGLIFGTANIATSTLTNWDMESFHIYSGTYGNATGVRDVFRARAQTSLVISNTVDKLLNQGTGGKAIVGASLVKEIIHLKSDVYSKDSLPLPVISAVSPVLAGELAKRGFDMANTIIVGKQASYAVLINTLVAMIHSLFYDEYSSLSRKMYEVRTRKILSYSNIIASSSNVVVSLCQENIKLLDVGGLAVTLFRIISDTNFIGEIKRDFLKNELHNQVVGSQYDFMEGK